MDDSESNVVLLPGVTRALDREPGMPRKDIADVLKYLAERALNGEFDALVVIASVTNGGMLRVSSTPENAPYGIIGAMRESEMEILMDRVLQKSNEMTQDFNG